MSSLADLLLLLANTPQAVTVNTAGYVHANIVNRLCSQSVMALYKDFINPNTIYQKQYIFFHIRQWGQYI